MNNCSRIVGASRLCSVAEPSKIKILALDSDRCLEAAIEPGLHALEGASAVTRLFGVCHVLRLSADPKIRAPIVEAVPIDMVNGQAGGWLQEESMKERSFAVNAATDIERSMTAFGASIEIPFTATQNIDIRVINNNGVLANNQCRNISAEVRRPVAGVREK